MRIPIDPTARVFSLPSRVWAVCVVAGILASAALEAQDAPAPKDDARAKAEAFVRQLQTGRLPCPLDTLADIPAVWALTPDRLDAAFAVPKGLEITRNPFFQWMTKDRTRAVFMKRAFNDLKIDLSMFGGELPVEEAVVDFLDGKLNGITFSLYNRGDSGEITKEDFQKRFKLCGTKIGAQLDVRPSSKKANPVDGLLSEGWLWVSSKGMAILENNPEANTGSVAFLRLKLAPRDAKGSMSAAFQSRSAAMKLSDLPKNVVKQPEGDVYIKGIPMVDQGPKGYCVVASVQRLFEYYGIPADEHQIAQVAGTDAHAGTSILAMSEALKKIDYRFKTRFKILCLASNQGLVEVNERKMTVGKPFGRDKFAREIHQHVDQGIPLLWALTLGLYPEEPSIAQQVGGGHMRMIIGYNDKTGQVLFSDSWGTGHELKKMSMDHAFKATMGLFAMFPTVH